jgi:hypothetical protein
MARKIGSLGKNFLEGSGTSDVLYGDTDGTRNSATT